MKRKKKHIKTFSFICSKIISSNLYNKSPLNALSFVYRARKKKRKKIRNICSRKIKISDTEKYLGKYSEIF